MKDKESIVKENERLGRCIGVYRGAWKVDIDGETYQAKINNSFRGNDYPAVGDFVSVFLDEQSDFVLIKDLADRKTEIMRKLQDSTKQMIAANIDIIFIVTSMNKEFNIGKLERFVVIGKQSGAKVCFVLTKSDQCLDIDFYTSILDKRFPEYPKVVTSSFEGVGIDSLKEYWSPNETAIFIGSSGVGKSTLINSLANHEIAKTSEIREKDSKGRHTTTSREMYILEDGRIVIDVPGVRSVGVVDASKEIDEAFSQINELSNLCKFTNCTHKNEPGCSIISAIENEIISKEEYKRYLKLKSKEYSKKITKGEIELTPYEASKVQKKRKKEDKKRRRWLNFSNYF